MRLVKAAAVAFLALGCSDATPDVVEAAGPDCSMVLTRPVRPRLRTVAADGSIADLAPLACAACAIGGRGAFAFRDEAGIVVDVGGVRTRVAPAATSRVGHGPVSGVLLARRAAAIDVGTHLDVIDAEQLLPARLELPPMGPDERVAAFARRGPASALGVKPAGAARVARWTTTGDYDVAAMHNAEGQTVARVDGEPPIAVVFQDGRRVVLPTQPTASSVSLHGELVLVQHAKGAWLIWQDGTIDSIPAGIALAFSARGTPFLVDIHRRTVFAVDAPGARRVVRSPALGEDLAGALLPIGGRARKLQVSAARGRMLVIERIENKACILEDRVHVLELESGAVKTLAAGDGMRTNPLLLDDGFGFVEADVDYSTP